MWLSHPHALWRCSSVDAHPESNHAHTQEVEGSEKRRVVLAKREIKTGETIAEETAMAAAFEPTVAVCLCLGLTQKGANIRVILMWASSSFVLSLVFRA